jgi:purine-nucleoside/S-methyl-5'-thioadenosine phosphorylase / adenosine deaminase
VSVPAPLLTSALLERAGLPHLFTTREFPGVADAGSGALFTAEAGPLLADRGLAAPAAFARQVHGAAVLVAERAGRVGEGDVLVTEQRGLPLAIITADCLPIVIYDPLRRRLGAVHAGWRGTVQSVTRAAVDRLVESGSDADGLVVAIGPSIGPCCYEVDAPVIDRLRAAFPGGWEHWVTPAGPGKWMLDLWAANEDQLTAADVDPNMIDNLRLCTACNLDRFYSYRREGSTRLGRLGRLVALAAIPDQGPATVLESPSRTGV